MSPLYTEALVVGVQWCSLPQLFQPLINHPAARGTAGLSMNPVMRRKQNLLRNWKELHVVTPLTTHDPLV